MKYTQFIAGLLSLCVLAPNIAVAQDPSAGQQRDFVLTAYYSPLPDQCCYIEGSEESDKVMNGEGRLGADGTEVYPGMIAAPASYAFGTRITLPGLGIMTVHDRGGAIQAGDNSDRLDVWVGYGEEGLARALAFGVKHIRGTVYQPGTSQPAESFDMTQLATPINTLKPYLVAGTGLVDLHPKVGQTGLSVLLLQQTLQHLGYFKGQATGDFGDATQAALAAFNSDYGLEGNGAELTLESAASLTAAERESKSASPVHFIDQTSPHSDIQQAQRLLRYLGFYRGRTDGIYSNVFSAAILHYQQSKQLVGDSQSPGAGTIGPLTRSALIADWKKRIVHMHAAQLIVLKHVGDLLAQRGVLVDAYLDPGSQGDSVRLMQQFLADNGFFPADKINGVYGDLTKQSVARYQVARGIIATISDDGAGSIGPDTLHQIRTEQIQSSYALVRAHGWNVL